AGELGFAGRFLVLEQLRDTEVEQLDLAVAGDQDVGRLEIAMDDEMRVCMRHGCTDLQEQIEARGDVELALIAPGVDRDTFFDVLEHEVRHAERRRSRIQQACDVRVRQMTEDLSFAEEAFARGRLRDVRMQDLDRDETVEASVAAAGEPYLAHAADAELPQQSIRAETDVRRGRVRGRLCIRGTPAARNGGRLVRSVRTEQREHARIQLRARRRKLRELVASRRRLERRDVFEQCEGFAPNLR